jgi:hypothetical protein
MPQAPLGLVPGYAKYLHVRANIFSLHQNGFQKIIFNLMEAKIC